MNCSRLVQVSPCGIAHDQFRRHPVDTCLSIFFADFFAREDYAWDRGSLAFFYRQYERLMDHWRRALPPGRYTEVEYETLVADREAETRPIGRFLRA